MQISITKPASNWFVQEMDLEPGSAVRFYVRYGGIGGIKEGFSLGITAEQPNDPITTEEVQGITFFVERSDAWYFEGVDLSVKYSRKWDDIQYEYPPHN
ncbi:hypothetical protein CHI12_05540 [Terribacillus saccharophilus]|jgi:uncharacterized protein YneR|uniref:FeS cluster biogenesis domain-containing protein n=1 Tax=Terribacillus saccharophilus TaxID=361277 RepID=A0A268HF27_9BACI|nr:MULTISPECIES: HesB/YadR/YfhF family protein [Terribacillus]PAD35374.1 hypothetical protein CHH56_09765 [Terribacillus saccharophilus]PAD96129.1 hypothetical protein CHH50_09960 [Terribacillus saccharophilus]PAD99535.1 hypothetical protein CHH48_11675 [Terribacillus saccharophilus]PAE08455.1 hypothetical protein CHI12_05540 [Terribacillus saccharophilus]